MAIHLSAEALPKLGHYWVLVPNTPAYLQQWLKNKGKSIKLYKTNNKLNTCSIENYKTTKDFDHFKQVYTAKSAF